MRNRTVTIDDDQVTKSFWARKACVREAAAYDLVHRLIDGIDLGDGWTARAPRIVKHEDRTLVMTRMPGDTLDGMIRRRAPIPWDKVGAALGHFHRRTAADGAPMRVFADFNRTNVMIDPASRTLSLIDPGVHGGRIGHPVEDVLTLLWGLFTVRLGARRLPGAERTLVRAWADASGVVVTAPSLRDAQHRIAAQLGARHAGLGWRKRSASFMLLPAWSHLWLPLVLRDVLSEERPTQA